MTDAGLTPEQEAVRRLLADARHDGPPPPEVVARLERTLETLVAERGSTPDAAPDAPSHAPAHDRPHDTPPRVVDLGSRRRRLASAGVLAAAAVVVAGIAVGQILPQDGGDDAGAGSSATSADSTSPGLAGGRGANGGARTEEDAGADAGLAPESLKGSAPSAPGSYPTLSSTDAELAQQLLTLRPGAVRRSSATTLEALSGCDGPRHGPGRRLVAEVDGQRGVVVFRRPDAEAQRAEVYVCGTPDPVRTLTLPAP
ncbi:hypothetical protein [Nocardioides xinjiangensis]|uniref:hypothetical protein n=1 Tax=Nocardioides xinjiangensis TaxID=2817376 RepID=UPI001B3158E6|nr:hypothetical protein [Nocardioides sp. SYSU D00778]